MFRYRKTKPVTRSADSIGSRSTLRKTNQIPPKIKTIGRINEPHPATWLTARTHQPVIALLCEDSKLSNVNSPTKTRKTPRISSLRSMDRRLQLHWRKGESGLCALPGCFRTVFDLMAGRLWRERAAGAGLCVACVDFGELFRGVPDLVGWRLEPGTNKPF